jgi:hypothetical protein
MVTGRVEHVEGHVGVLYGTVSLEHEAGCEYPDSAPGMHGLATGANCIQAGSAWQSHVAHIQVERWDVEPSAMPVGPGGEWDLAHDGEVSFTGDGILWACVLTDETSDVGLHFTAGTYRVRAYTRGGEQLQQIAEAILDADTDADNDEEDDELPEGIEQHLFQLWPA